MELTNTQLKQLLSENNINDKDIKGSGVNGRVLKQDRLKTLESIKIKSRRMKRISPKVVKLPTLPTEVISMITKDVDLPTKRLINKRYEKDTQKQYYMKLKKDLFNYIMNNTPEYYYKNKNTFQNNQLKIIDNLSNDDLIFYNILISKLENKNIINGMKFNRSSSYIYFENNQLIIA